MFEKLKRFGRNFTQTTPFILSNTVIFIPYLLFLGLTDSHNWLTILPFTLFYAFRMTGLFLVNSLRFGLDSYTLLMIALLIGGAGSLLGILGVFYFPLFYFSSVLLGLSAAWLVPANTTVNFHEKTQGFINMDGKKYLFAAIWLFLLYQAIELPAPTQIAAKIVGPWILKRLTWSPLAMQLLGLSSSLLVLLIPNGFAIGVFLLSFWHVVTGSWLNKEYYQTDTAIPMDRRIVVKYTTQNKGSVIHQFLLMTLLFVLAKEMGEPIHLLLITLNHESVPIESVQLLILAKWINVGLLLSGLVTVYHLWKKAKKNEAIH
ncbi:TPA: hypothetical protein LLE00_001674 [Enterococcus faecium]|nr:hypothetical protein [Enterococcus faecium]